MTFNQFITRLHADNRHPSLELLEDVLGDLLTVSDYSDLNGRIPNTDEFYLTVCDRLDMMGVPNVHTQQMDLADLIGVLTNGHLPLTIPGGTVPFFTNVQTQASAAPAIEPDETVGVDAIASTHLLTWMIQPKKLAAYLMNHTDSYDLIMQKFCTFNATDENLKNVLEIVFNEIPATNILKQCGYAVDLVAKSISYSGLSCSRGDFKRSIDQFNEIMKICNDRVYETDAECGICSEVDKVKVIKSDGAIVEFATLFKPYHCDHGFCHSCVYGTMQSFQGDYCSLCREQFKMT